MYTNTDLKICQYVRPSIKKKYVDGITLKHVLRFGICAYEISEKFVSKHSETTEYVKN